MNNLITKQFENTNIKIIELNGNLFFEVYSVGMALGHVKTSKGFEYPRKERIDESIRNAEIIPVVHDGQQYINESQLYDFMFEVHTEKVKPFKKWVTNEVLPALRKTGTYTIKNNITPQFKEVAEVIPLIAADLHVNDISKLVMYKGLCKDYNVPTGFLPNYVQGGDREMKSPTEALKHIEVDISTVKFNKLMIEKGYLEERIRKSTSAKGGVKKFKCLTEKGLKYGQNQLNPNNPKETQPYYYLNTFKELYHLIKEEIFV